MGNKVLRYEFENYCLLPTERLLLCEDKQVPLKSKVFETLLTLVRNHGDLMSKDQLMGQIWGSQVVEEGNLTQNIFTLRKAFGENPKDHRFIVTVPGRGYRFVPKVREITEAVGENRLPAGGTATNGSPKTLAVLPLRSLIRHKSDAEKYLGLAIADAVITHPGINRNLTVRSTETVLKYIESDLDAVAIGRELAVDVVLSGTIQTSPDRARASVRLHDTKTGDTLWAEKFDIGSDDIFELQDRISEQTADALLLQLNRNADARKPIVGSEIYQKYLKSRFFWETRTENGLAKSLEGAREIVSLAPDFALGYIAVADSYLLLGHHLFCPPGQVYPKVLEAAEMAMELDPHLAEAYATMADYCFIRKQWAEAEKNHLIAISLNPDYASARHWYSWFLMAMCRFDESLVQIEEAQRLDKNSLYLSTIRGVPLCYKGDFEGGIRQFRLVLEVDPGNKRAHYYLAWALVHSGDHRAGMAEFERVVAAEPIQQTFALLGYIYGLAGERKKALQILAHFDEMAREKYVSPYSRALIYSGLGDTERTFAELERAFAEDSLWLVWLKVDYCFRNLHADPRFQDLLARLSYPESDARPPQ